MTSPKIAPGVRQYLPLPYGWVSMARRKPIEFLMHGFRRFGDVFRYHVGPWVFHLLSHPDHVKHVLQDHVKNYPRSRFYEAIKLAVGEGLVTSEGPFWLRQRRLAQPAFHRDRIAAFAGLMTEATAAMLDRWHKHAASGQPVEVASEMVRLTLSIVGRALFSSDLSDEADAVGRAVTDMMEYLNYRINNWLVVPASVPTPRNLRFRRALRIVDGIVLERIHDRRRTGADHDDLLSMLLRARDAETGESMSDQHLRDELVTFIGAGHETTATALAWTWYLLSKYPMVDRQLRAEVSAVLGQRRPTVEDLVKLQYTRMVIEEAMRLYPPVWALTRTAAEDDEFGGYHIPAKSVVILSQYVTHRHPEFWENPEGFDPERFAPERYADRPRYAYFPFAGGPHQCIGVDFAMMEAQFVVAMVAQRFRLHLVSGYEVEPDPIFTLRPRPGVLVTLHPV